MGEKVILVDENGDEVGIEEKIKAHREGKLHLAFSIFIFNNSGEILLQRRAKSKYHSGGLWTNTCCSHPRPGEKVEEAAHRRLRGEMGFDCNLEKVFSLIYKVNLDHNLTEYEFDHVFVGKYGGDINPNRSEVHGFKWVRLGTLKEDMEKHPKNYTAWFKIVLKKLGTLPIFQNPAHFPYFRL